MSSKKKALLFLLGGMALGILITLAVLRSQPQLTFLLAGRSPPPPHPLAPFGEEEDPFEAMRQQMQSQFLSQMGQPPLIDDKLAENSIEVHSREDEKFVYVEIKLPGGDGSKVKAHVDGDYLVITGETEQKEEKANQGTFFHSSSSQSLPLPRNVVADKMEMYSENGQLVLKFPKKKR